MTQPFASEKAAATATATASRERPDAVLTNQGVWGGAQRRREAGNEVVNVAPPGCFCANQPWRNFTPDSGEESKRKKKKNI